MKEALNVLLGLSKEAAAGTQAALPASIRDQVIALPTGIQLQSVEKNAPARFRPRGNYQTHLSSHFITFVEQMNEQLKADQCPIFIKRDEMTARCIFNYADSDGKAGAGHQDHYAEVKLKETPAYKYLFIKFNDTQHKQRKLVELLEEFAEEVQLLNSSYQKIPTADALNALATIDIKATRDIRSSEQEYSTELTSAEKIAMQATQHTPSFIRVTLQTHEGMSPQTFDVRLSFIGDDTPLITTRLLRHEKVAEAIALELEQQLSSLKNPIFHGSFS